MARSVDDLSSEVDGCLVLATRKLELLIEKTVHEFIEQFYGEWHPSKYHRLEQLYKSLIKSDLHKTPTGYEATVYLDFTKMKHDPVFSDLSEEEIGTIAATSSRPHGLYREGTTIWRDPMEYLSAEKVSLLREALIDAGVPLV